MSTGAAARDGAPKSSSAGPRPRPPPQRFILDRACQVWFATWQLCLLAVLYFVLGAVHAMVPAIRKSTAERLCGRICGFVFRMVLIVCPWIRVSERKTTAGRTNDLTKLLGDGAKGRGKLVLMNHVSFVDALICAELLARKCGGREFRFLMGANLFNIPLWGTMCRRIGHFPVHSLVSQNEGKSIKVDNLVGVDESKGDAAWEDYRVDRVKQLSTNRAVDEYLRRGGSLVLFPEGTINRLARRWEPVTSLSKFRFGGFNFGIRHGLDVVGIVSRGCEYVWPWKVALGGFPGQVSLVGLPLGTLRENDDNKEVSTRLRAAMQTEIRALYSTPRPKPLPALAQGALGIALFVALAFILLPLIGCTIIGVGVGSALWIIMGVVGFVARKLGCGSKGDKAS